ncbi:MAG: CBS domain-containing protein [Chloroflexota bacterium]
MSEIGTNAEYCQPTNRLTQSFGGSPVHRIPIRDIMKTPVVTISPDALAVDAAQLMEEHSVRRLPVVDQDGLLIGIVTDSDVLEAETAETVLSSYEPGAEEEWLAVEDVMTRDIVTISPEHSVGELAIQFMKHKVGGVPVVEPVDDDGAETGRLRTIGIVTETDIFRLIADAWLAEEKD